MYQKLSKFWFGHFGTSYILYVREEKSTETSYNKTIVVIECCRMAVRCKNSKKMDCKLEKNGIMTGNVKAMFSAVNDDFGYIHGYYLD